jgi:ribonuclease P protein subunit RPR2
MSKKKLKNKKLQKKIANERIKKLFYLTKVKVLDGDYYFANRYIFLIRKLAMKYRLSLPKEIKRSYCKNCYYLLIPSKNCRIRIHRRKIIIFCYNCKKYIRLPLTNFKYMPSARLK